MVSAADFLAAASSDRVRKVTVAGLDAYVRKLSGRERMEIGNRARSGKGLEMHEYIVLAVCNEDGSPMFTPEEALALGEADGWLAEQLVNEILVAARPVATEDGAKN